MRSLHSPSSSLTSLGISQSRTGKSKAKDVRLAQLMYYGVPDTKAVCLVWRQHDTRKQKLDFSVRRSPILTLLSASRGQMFIRNKPHFPQVMYFASEWICDLPSAWHHSPLSLGIGMNWTMALSIDHEQKFMIGLLSWTSTNLKQFMAYSHS